MEIVIIWIALCFVAAVIASNKGRSGLGFFLLAAILSPLVGIPAACVARRDDGRADTALIARGERKKCPYCAELVRADAVVCRFCQRELDRQAPLPPINACTTGWPTMILLVGLGLVVIFFALIVLGSAL